MSGEITQAVKDKFKKELKSLLEKYDASIIFSCDDFQGVQGEEMCIEARVNRPRFEYVQLLNVPGSSIDADNLKGELK